MIARIETFIRHIRRNLSRSEWLRRLLQLPISRGAPTRPGLIMIQIDGLSQKQFTRALERGELPFLRRLVQREHYQVHAQYSGLPSSTPAIQGELFYGIKGIVPAFSFKDRKLDRVVRMYEPETAARVAAQLEEEGSEGLLDGGSSYANIFTGGAEESHFCPSSLGWEVLRSAKPLVVLTVLFGYLYSFLRVGALLALEFVLGIIDFIRGLTLGQDFLKELKFIPTRVGICVLLRELCVIGGKIDIHRGLPVIHINFLGYDEQAHRRGPNSAFAHWTLKGIDDAIARLWRAANHSAWRHYEVWVYSDHGQIQAKPYHLAQHGHTLEEAVTEAFAAPAKVHKKISESIQTQRVRLLGGKKLQRLFTVLGFSNEPPEGQEPEVVALGPVGLVYSPQQLSLEERERIACELARTHKVPVVITRQSPDLLVAWTETGKFYLPEQTAELFGSDHPFLDAIGEDLVRLCHHPEAGEFVLLGWHKDSPSLTFASENGSHAGISPDETNAFSLLPQDTLLPTRDYNYLRPGDLRQAALQYMGRLKHSPIVAGRRRQEETPSGRLRIMTYNVHRCVGMDSKLAVERIARVIARANPDVVALQELDVGRSRTDGLDQAKMIARYLEMEFHFHPAMHIAEERYGDAILTHLPLRLVKAGPLPGLESRFRLEPRGALWLAIDLYGTEVQIINTHLGLHPRERLAQGKALAGNDWLGNEDCPDPVILCGDFNALPSSSVYKLLCKRLNDVQVEMQRYRPRAGFPGRFPAGRIDHIFISPGLEVRNIEIPRSELALVASDHLPLVADILIPGKLWTR